jgi:hypothetical protein
LANVNQTWYTSSLGKGKTKDQVLFKGGIIAKIREESFRNFKNNPMNISYPSVLLTVLLLCQVMCGTEFSVYFKNCFSALQGVN